MSTVNTSNTSTNLPLDGQNQSSGRHNRSPLVNDNPNSPSQRRRITETSVLGDLIAIDPYANLLGGLGSNNQLPNLQKRGGVSPLLLLRMTWPNQYTPSWVSGLSPLLFKMPEEARTAAILATQCAVLSRLKALTTGVAQLRTAAAQTAEITLLSHADQVRTW
ncbi:hypothetical protein Pst134EB_023464 [Puccinia striiformis f. sp. tritici]|nr:hypothetical protein Pst134EB_023464 [Puccinia striiformis f. sp. tritici]